MRTSHVFVHVLLFECPKCGKPVSTHHTSSDSNLELVDGSAHDLTCQCGWSGSQLGLRARRHWTESWPVPASSPV